MLVVVGVVVASWVGVFRVRRGRWPGTPLYRRLGLAPPNLAGRGWGDGPCLHARHTVHRDTHVLFPVRWVCSTSMTGPVERLDGESDDEGEPGSGGLADAAQGVAAIPTPMPSATA